MNKPYFYNRNNFGLNNNCFLNSVRRVLINEIETYTFDNVVFNNFNSSIYNTEYIIQRLRLIPLIQSNVNNYKDIKLRCNITNKSEKFMEITPSDIKTLDGKPINTLINKNIYNNLPIIYLPPNETIDFTCELIKNNETGYNKFCHAWYDDENFYIESIDKSYGNEVITAIEHLINQCKYIKTQVINNYLNVTQNNFKIDIKLENISRSALNFIVDTARSILKRIISLIVANGDYNKSKTVELTPSDFIISIVQPHLSENKYSVLFDINLKYLIKSIEEQQKLNVLGYFMGYLNSKNIQYTDYINTNNAVFVFIGCIDCAINDLEMYKLKFKT